MIYFPCRIRQDAVLVRVRRGSNDGRGWCGGHTRHLRLPGDEAMPGPALDRHGGLDLAERHLVHVRRVSLAAREPVRPGVPGEPGHAV